MYIVDAPIISIFVPFYLNQENQSEKQKKNTKSPYHVNVTRMMAQSSAHGVPLPPTKDFS